MEAIILVGGFGTRLQNVVKDVPKPMAQINNKPFLEYLLNYLSQYKIDHIILSVGYKKNIIMDYFKTGYKNIKITYSQEDKPLGTGGALKKALQYVNNDKVLVFNGDTFFDINLDTLKRNSRKHNKITIALKEMENIERYGSVELDKFNNISNFKEKQFFTKAFINGGIYLLSKSIFEDYKKTIFSFEDFLEKNFHNLNANGVILNNSYFIDIGVPEDYRKAQLDFKEIKFDNI
jgi:D-glycero-alpha-D-manno-heptose 1-phosphate guanylyltransferase